MNPACRVDLFAKLQSGKVASIDELAHVIAKSEDGPRGDGDMTPSDRDEYDNIILLCANCHTIVDKADTDFPPSLLRQWKADHLAQLTTCFSVPLYASRSNLADAITPLLRRNRALFDEYGPHSDVDNPLTDRSRAWLRFVKSDVVPNNRRILQTLLKNQSHLSAEELDVMEAFRIHAEAFEYNHFSGDKLAVAPLFPAKMNDMLS